MEEEKKLTDKQRRFCEEYVIDWNGTRAAIAAGYSERTAKQIASENLRKNYIRDYINSIEQESILKLKSICAEKEKSDNGFVYLIHCEDTSFYKIGKTTRDIKYRLKSLQSMNPFRLTLVTKAEVKESSLIEKEMQDFFRNNNVRGEWFSFNDNEIKEVIAKVNSYDRIKII